MIVSRPFVVLYPGKRGHLMNRIVFRILLVFIGASFSSGYSQSTTAKYPFRGVVYLENLKGDKSYGEQGGDFREWERYCPASTFKIFNTLILLTEEAVSLDQVIPWDGVQRNYPGWDQDQTLETAFRGSMPWVYSTLSGQVSRARYEKYLRIYHYGNAKLGPRPDYFWLDDSLRISPQEQVAFMRNIYRQKWVKFRKYYPILKQWMFIEGNEEYKLYAKTGWASDIEYPLGWYVGYVETAGEVWLFALVMDLPEPGMLPMRKEKVMEMLRKCGIISLEK